MRWAFCLRRIGTLTDRAGQTSKGDPKWPVVHPIRPLAMCARATMELPPPGPGCRAQIPSVVLQLVDRVVHDVAARIVMDRGGSQRAAVLDTYEDLYLEQFWAGLALADPGYSRSVPSGVGVPGSARLEQLSTNLLPRSGSRSNC